MMKKVMKKINAIMVDFFTMTEIFLAVIYSFIRRDIYTPLYKNIYEFLRKLLFKIIKKRNTANKKEKQLSVVEEIHFKKRAQYKRTLTIIWLSIISYLGANVILNIDIKIEVLIFLCVLFSLIAILKLLIDYRIEKGYYGTNYEESKEILYYIIESKDKNDKNSGKKIFNDAYNKVSKQAPALNGEVEY